MTKLILCLTNSVAENFTANTLLALGASPLMCHHPDELSELIAISEALLINIGTLSPGQIPLFKLAARLARERGLPWVLDPVGAGASSLRLQASFELLSYQPNCVKGNRGEILALAGDPAYGQGVDSKGELEQGPLERALAGMEREHGGSWVATGEIDFLHQNSKTTPITGGHEWMAKSTGMGCALGAALAFALAENGDLSSMLKRYKRAGLAARESARGLGDFPPQLLTHLAQA